MNQNVLKVFISCPSGHADELNALKTFIERTNGQNAQGLQIKLVHWEKGIPSKLGLNAQDFILEHLENCDGYIGLMSEKVGSADGGESGTIAEFDSALEMLKERNDIFSAHSSLNKFPLAPTPRMMNWQPSNKLEIFGYGLNL